MRAYVIAQDYACSRFLLLAWIISDAIVAFVLGETDDHWWKFLTNQVWVFGILSKLCLCYVIIARGADSLSITFQDKLAVVLFLLLGALQLGVIIAFFVLLALDSTILDTMLTNQTLTLAEIILGNHARHVLPVMLHFVLCISLRFYISVTVNTIVRYDCETETKDESILGRAWFAVLLLVGPSAVGITHTLLFDDQQLYKFGSKEIGSTCQLAFGLTAIIGSIYYLYVLVIPPQVLAKLVKTDAVQNDGAEDSTADTVASSSYIAAAGMETVRLKQ